MYVGEASLNKANYANAALTQTHESSSFAVECTGNTLCQAFKGVKWVLINVSTQPVKYARMCACVCMCALGVRFPGKLS